MQKSEHVLRTIYVGQRLRFTSHIQNIKYKDRM